MTRPVGPPGAPRPYQPEPGSIDAQDRSAHALEHIAFSLAAIDQHLEALLEEIRRLKSGG